MNAEDAEAKAALYEAHLERQQEGQEDDPSYPQSPKNKTAMSYDDIFTPVEHPNEVVIAVGGEGSGKTYFAATAPGPLHVIGTEAGHEVVTLVRDFPEKDIRHLALEPKRRKEAENIWFGPWEDVDETLNQAVDVLVSAEKGTVIIDSASDLLAIAAASFNYTFQRGDDPIPPMMYGQLYPLLEGWIAEIRRRHNIVLCCRVKNEYANDEKTGNKVVDLWKTGPYLAESVVWLNRAPLGEKRMGAVTKGINDGRLLYDPTWETVTQQQPVEHDARPMRQALKRLRAAYKYLESEGIEAKRKVPDTLQGVSDRIEGLRSRLGGGDDE